MNAFHRYKPYVLVAVMDAFATQIYIDLFSDNFRISVAVLLPPVVYYFNYASIPWWEPFHRSERHPLSTLCSDL